MALEAEDADLRREAVVQIARSRHSTSDDGFAVLDVVARTDPVIQTRCVAIRALAGYKDDRPVGTLLTILRAKEGSDKTLPADDDIRWEVATALMALENKGVLVGVQRELACELFVNMLRTDLSRNVRIVATEALGAFQDPKVFDPLIGALRNKDFAIADRAEHSLIALTGTTHHYDADAWQEWLDKTENPFARAGQTPQETRPAGPTWWDQQKRIWRQRLKMGTD